MANIIFEFSLIFIIGFEIFFEKVHFGLTQTLAFIVLIAGTVIYFKAGISPISVSIVSVGLIGSFFAAVSYIALKKASLEADPWMIYWTLCLVSVPLAFVINTGEWALPSMSSSLALTVIAFGTLVGQYLLVVSFEKLPLAVAAALVPSCIVWSVVWDGVIDGDINLSAGLGSLVYTLGVCGLLIERKKDHKRLHGHHVTSR